MPDDATLLAAWADGDKAAGDVLLKRHFDTLYLFFRTKISGPVDDLIQATLLGMVESRSSYRGEASFKTFLLGIARKQLLRYFRDRYRAGKVFDPAQTSVVGVAPETSASQAVERADDRELLVAALRNIPLDLQITLELHYWEEMSVAEVGEVLEIPPGTVKSRLHRARKLLDQEMERLGAGAELRASTAAGLATWAERVRSEL